MQHPLLRALVPTQIGISSSRSPSGRLECPKGIDRALFLYCAKGRGWCEMGGARHAVGPGDLLVVPPFTPHSLGAEGHAPWTIPWVQITGENVAPLLEQLGVTPQTPIIKLGDDPRLMGLFDEAVTDAENARTYTTTAIFNTSQTVGHLLGRILMQRRKQAQRPPDAKERIAHCIEFMKQNLGQPLQIERLAALANLSVSRFSALFTKETGCAPGEFLIQLRMRRACELLERTELTLVEIGLETGYGDVSYFCRAFRHIHGVPPGEYRKARRQG